MPDEESTTQTAESVYEETSALLASAVTASTAQTLASQQVSEDATRILDLFESEDVSVKEENVNYTDKADAVDTQYKIYIENGKFTIEER